MNEWAWDVVGMIMRGTTEIFGGGGDLSQCHSFHPKLTHHLPWDWKRDSEERYQRLIDRERCQLWHFNWKSNVFKKKPRAWHRAIHRSGGRAESRVEQIFHKSRRKLKIPNSRKVTWSILKIENPQTVVVTRNICLAGVQKSYLKTSLISPLGVGKWETEILKTGAHKSGAPGSHGD